jgi:cobalt-zinc-cadmium resistance protein CzcA
MLAHLIQFALTQRALVVMAAVGIAISGVLAFRATPTDAFPDVSTTQVKIIMKAAGMTPEEVESRITAPIEVEMLGIPHQRILRSMTKYALADITVDFDEGTDIYWARQQVAERLSALWDELPAGASGGLAPITTPLGEMFMFTIEGGELSLEERRTLLDWVVRPALRTVPGVADVNSLGGHVRTLEVVPDNARMLARGISFGQLREALETNNRNDGAGRLTEGEEVVVVRAEGRIRNLDDLRAVVVRADPVEPVRVGDLADVRLGSLTRYGAVTRDGVGEAVQGLVLGLRGANARAVVEGVRKRIAEISPMLPAGVEIRVFYDRGDLVARAMHGLQKALAEAGALVVVVLLLFLGHVRPALIAALVLPLSVLCTFLWMRAFDMSANLMSLGGLAIALGMLVDSAVVVVENVEAALHRPEAARHTRAQVVYRAAREVAAPVTSGIGIIMLVFLPLLTLEGLEGKLFVPVALTIVFALGSSLALSLTVIPALASMLLTSGHAGKTPRIVSWLEDAYERLLRLCLRHERIVVAVALSLLVVAAILYTRTGKTFLPTMDEGDVLVQLEKLPSIALEPSLDLDLRVQRAILDEVPEVSRIVARTGSDELGLDPMGLNQTDSFLVLRPRSEWQVDSKSELIEKLRAVLERFPGLRFGFTQPIEMRISEMLTGVRGDVAVKIFGPRLEALSETSERIGELLGSLEGAQDVFRTQMEGAQYLSVEIDRLRAGRIGLSVDAIQARLRAELEGTRVGTVFEGVRRTPLVVRGAEQSRRSPEAFENLGVPLPEGRSIALGQVARVRRVEGPVQVSRENGERFTVVVANVEGRDLVGFVEEARRLVGERIALPPDVRLEWGGQFENQQRAARRLGLVIPVALALIFLLLFSTFGSVVQAGIILANVPFALVGGIASLWSSGEYLSVPASVGLIALLGIAVLNAVVLVSHFNELRASGLGIERTVIEGARRRLRPVLMTATCAAFGLLPLLFASGPGSELERPLAIVVIGGLVSCTSLTLILLPILYRRVAREANEES